MTRGAPLILVPLQRAGKIDGVISLGGGGGTAIGTAAMRALPVGFPKLMVSTLAAIRSELVTDSLVYRYDPALAAADGLEGQEGTFSICSFWWVEALARAGYLEEEFLVAGTANVYDWPAPGPAVVRTASVPYVPVADPEMP